MAGDKVIHMAFTEVRHGTNPMNGKPLRWYVALCFRCGWESTERRNSRGRARRDGDAHLAEANAEA